MSTTTEPNYKDFDAATLYSNFTKERVQSEMNLFLSKELFPRFGGGIGMTRMVRALKMSNLI